MSINPYEPPQEEGTPVAKRSVPLARIAEGWLAGGIVGCVLSWLFVPVHHYIPGDRICLCVIAVCTIIGGAVARVLHSAPARKNFDK